MFLQRGQFGFMFDHSEVVALQVVLREVGAFCHGNECQMRRYPLRFISRGHERCRTIRVKIDTDSAGTRPRAGVAMAAELPIPVKYPLSVLTRKEITAILQHPLPPRHKVTVDVGMPISARRPIPTASTPTVFDLCYSGGRHTTSNLGTTASRTPVIFAGFWHLV
jgi:hypothetical protein